jgi:hypothetical protein
MTSLDVYWEDKPRRRVRQLFIADRPSISKRKLRKVFPDHSSRLFASYFAMLDSLVGSGSAGSSEPISQESLDRARAILHKLESEKLQPLKIVPAAEGGVAICFANHEKYSDIECLNSGEILGVISNRRDHPTVWEIEPSADGFAKAIARIRDFLTSTETHDAKESAA